MVDTKKVFDTYFELMPEEKSKKIRPQVDRREVYDYEIKLKKSIFEMDSGELFDMLMTFGNNRTRTPDAHIISPATYTQVSSLYRTIWNYYIDNFEVIKNPWYDKSMRGIEAEKRLLKVKGNISYKDIKRAINSLSEKYPEDVIKYLECTVLLFYNGIPTSKDIVLLSEDDINFRTKEISLPGRTIKLSDRCFELLNDIHMMVSSNPKYTLSSYHNSYYRFYVINSKVDSFQDRSIETVARIISKKIDTDLRSNCGLAIGCRTIYLLGFYDFIVSQLGSKRTNDIIYAYRDSDSTRELEKYAALYGVAVSNITALRKSLKLFVNQ